MSHAATNWAIQQRGLKPAAKVVLWHLCDRYHPDNGCFPSQETLAADCELSRSALNEHLSALEAAGLIRRERRHNARTKQRERTRYRLAFEADFEPMSAPAPAGFGEDPCPEFGHGEPGGAMSGKGAEPCPEIRESHVRIPDNNPVREPVKEPGGVGAGASGLLERGKRVCAAMGIAWDDPGWRGDFAVIASWDAAGYDFDLDVLPVVAEVSRGRDGPPASLSYFTRAIGRANRRRLSPPALGEPGGAVRGATWRFGFADEQAERQKAAIARVFGD